MELYVPLFMLYIVFVCDDVTLNYVGINCWSGSGSRTIIWGGFGNGLLQMVL